MYKFINDTNCKCLTEKCLKRYFIFKMPTETIKFGVCSDYIRLLLMHDVKKEERLYDRIWVKHRIPDIVIELLSNYTNVYDDKNWRYKKVDKNDFTKLVVDFKISDKFICYRSMPIMEALSLIVDRNNDINFDFYYHVRYCLSQWINNLKSKVSKSKYEELIRLNKKVGFDLNYDESFQREFLIKMYQAQIKTKQ